MKELMMIKEQVMKSHLDQRMLIEEYVIGETLEMPEVEDGCRADCLLANWLHSAGSKQCIDVCMLDSLCSSCEEFREAAVQVILLTTMGEKDMAMDELRSGKAFSDASDDFQLNLIAWQRRCAGSFEARV